MSFNDDVLLKKIKDLVNTQQSVQTLSLWLIHHRLHSKSIVQTWLSELLAAQKCERKITYIYLANDILQNSRKKGSEFLKEFSAALPAAIENTSKAADSKTRFTLERIFNIWKDRRIYPDEVIKKFKVILHSQPKLSEEASPSAAEEAPAKPAAASPASKSKATVTEADANGTSHKMARDAEDEMSRKRLKAADTNVDKTGDVANNNKLVKKSLREQVLKELANNTVTAPEPMDLISMIHELESSASSDAVIRERIAELPPKVIDANGVKNIKDKKQASALLESVNDAAKLVDEYNSRLQQELTSRKKTALLMGAYIQQKRTDNENAQAQIDEWQKKLEHVKAVEKELQVHLKSLPDLTSIEEAAILKPLPSAGDLFSS